MNKAEENRLSELARTAKDLRACIDAADSMMRSWARRKAEAGESGEIYLSLSDRRTRSIEFTRAQDAEFEAAVNAAIGHA